MGMGLKMRMRRAAAAAAAMLAALATDAEADTFTTGSPGTECTAGMITATLDVCLSGCQQACVDSDCPGIVYDAAMGTSSCKLVNAACYMVNYDSPGYQARADGSGSECGNKDFNLIWVFDESGSVSSANYDRMKDFAIQVSSGASFANGKTLTEVAYIEFSNKVYSVASTLTDLCSFEDEVGLLTRRGGSTNIDDGLRYAISKRQAMVAETATIIILLTDGEPNKYGTGSQVYGCSAVESGQNRNSCGDAARARAREISAIPGTYLVYGAIDKANTALFDDINDVSLVDISNWDLASFVSTVEGLIGDAVCLTESPTDSPTPKPTGNPTESPTPFPTPEPTQMPTTLPPSVCTVLDSGVTTVSFPDDGVDDQADLFTISAGAAVSNEGIDVASGLAGTAMSSSYAFHTNKDNLVGGFIANFVVEIDPEATSNEYQAEGFAFVIHDREGGLVDIPTATGRGLGFLRIENSISFVIDLCTDRSDGTDCNEFDAYMYYNTEHTSAIPSDSDFYSYDFVDRQSTYNFTFMYLEQAEQIAVYESGRHLFSQYGFRMENVIGSTSAYIGFTASTNAQPVLERISEWSIRTVGIDYAQTDSEDIVDGATAKTLTADGETEVSFSIQTYDVCSYEIDFGGFSSDFSALFVEDLDPETGLYYDGATSPTVEAATVVDNGDGSYSAVLKTEMPNVTFSVYATFGKGCALEIATNGTSGVDVVDVSLADGNTTACFFAGAAEAVATVPPPPVASPAPDPITNTEPENQTAALKAAIGGGVAAGLLVVAAVALLRFRRRWHRDEKFIYEGKLANLERDIVYADGNDDVIARLQSSREELLRVRAEAQTSHDPAEISRLQTESETLKAEIRTLKHTMAAAEAQASRPMSIFFRARSPKHNRKQFGVDDDDDLGV